MSASQQLLLGNSYTNPWEIQAPWPDGFDPQTLNSTVSVSYQNGTRTVLSANIAQTNNTCIAAYGTRNTGKWYWEIVVNATGNSAACGWQAAQMTPSDSTADTSSAGYLGFFADPDSFNGAFSKAGSAGSGIAPSGVGVLWRFAVDLDSGRVWIGTSSGWHLGGDPANGVNPLMGPGSVVSGSPPFTLGLSQGSPVLSMGGNFAAGSSMTGNMSAASQVFPAPDGFLPWASGFLPLYRSPDWWLPETQLVLNAQGAAGSSTFLDESTFNRAITARNGLILDSTPTPPRGSTSFIGNGTNRNAITPFTTNIGGSGTTSANFPNTYCFEGWFRFDALGTGTQRFVLIGVCNNANPTLQTHYNIYVYWQNPNLGIRVGATDVQFNASSFITTGVWNYISVAVSDSRQFGTSAQSVVSVHINGIGRFSSTATIFSSFTNNQCINIMGLRDAGTIDMYAFNGQAQCLRFTLGTSRYIVGSNVSTTNWVYPVPPGLLPGRFSSPAVSRTVLLSGLQATAQQGIAESQNKTISLTGLQASSQVGVSAIRGWPYLQSTTYLPSNNIKTGNWFSDATITLSITNDGLVNIVASGTNALGQPTNYNLSSFWAQELNGSYPVAGFFAQNIRAIVTYTDDGNWVGIPAYGSSVFLGTTQTYTYTLATSNTTPTVRRIGVGIQLVADGLLLGQVFAAAGSAVFSPTVATIVLYFDIGRI